MNVEHASENYAVAICDNITRARLVIILPDAYNIHIMDSTVVTLSICDPTVLTGM